MGVIRYDITEEAFYQKQLPSNELSILAGVDSSSYLVTDTEHQVLALRALSHATNDFWWSTDERMHADYAKIRIAWLSNRFTIIPARFYNGDARRSYLAGLTDLQDNETILADALPGLDAFLVYAINQDQLSNWRRAFVGSRFYHALTPILHSLGEHNRLKGRAKMYAYIRSGMLVTIGLDRNKLVFCNAFVCPNTKDYLYYLLLSYEQCQWQPAQVPLCLFGEVMTDSEIYKLFFRYVKEVNFLPASNQVKWGTQAAQQPPHLFYDLATVQLYH